MNYTKHYNNLIVRSKNRTLDGYKEKHHIIPKCMGGTDDPSNIAILTPEEHFVAHQLLVKMYPGNSKLIFAAHMMTVNSQLNKRTNKEYGWLKQRRAEEMSKKMKGKTAWNKGICGEESPRFGKKMSEETRQKQSESRKKYNLENPNPRTGKKDSQERINKRVASYLKTVALRKEGKE